MIPVGQSPSLVNPFILDSLDWAARSNAPTLPTSTGLRFWVQNTQGISRLHYSDNTPGDDIVVNRDLLLIARNGTASPLTDGQVVYVSGATGSVPQVSLAQSVAGKLPAIGIVMGTIAVNGFGYVHMFGVHSSTNTNAFNVGDNLYVSAVTPGALTNIEPTAPFQFIGVVLVKGVGNGVIYLRPTGPTFAHTILDGDEHSDTVAHVPVLGDVIFGNATPKWDALAGNITTTRKFLRQVGTGVVSAAPAWDTILGSDITGAALTKTDDTNVTLTLGGSPTTALLNAASLTLGWTGTLAVSRGGTGQSTLGTNAVLTGNGTGAIGNSTDVTYDGTDFAIASGKRFRMQSQNRTRYLNSMAVATRSNAQTGNTVNIWTTVGFDTETTDTDGLHDTVTNNSRFTFPLVGKWLVGCTMRLDDTNITTPIHMGVRIIRNGSTAVPFATNLSAVPVGSTQSVISSGLALVVATATTDYVESQGIITGSAGTWDVLSSVDNQFVAFYIGE